MTITFIGGGNMASAIAGGLVARGRPASGIAIVDPVDAQRAKLEAALPGVRTYASVAAAAIAGSSIVVLAVKPQQMREACTALAPHVARCRSCCRSRPVRAAATSRAGWAATRASCARCPTRPRSSARASAACGRRPRSARTIARPPTAILDACGEVVPVDREETLDAVTGVSASGPAYVFYLIESLEAAARAQGFDAASARKLAYATFEGSVKLATASDEDCATLRARVTSKGGTTERGIAALEAAHVREAIAAAVDAATKRATEMGDLLGRDG